MKKSKIIADAGSSKIDWVVMSSEGEVLASHSSDGLNALLAEDEDVRTSFLQVKEQLGENHEVDEIFYYGAGCATPRVCNRMTELVAEIWNVGNAAMIHVSSDLLGAARALFGNEQGVACILGTGSNSCLYNGSEIEINVPSLGYVLGDEGSGAALGKRLVADAFKKHLPQIVRDKFLDEYHLTLTEILDRVYRTPSPNKFLASLVPFIKENIWNPYVYSVVYQEFSSFMKRNVAMYPGAHFLPVGFIGSIAVVFEDILREVAREQGFKVSKIVKAPMSGLIEYHQNV